MFKDSQFKDLLVDKHYEPSTALMANGLALDYC